MIKFYNHSMYTDKIPDVLKTMEEYSRDRIPLSRYMFVFSEADKEKVEEEIKTYPENEIARVLKEPELNHFCVYWCDNTTGAIKNLVCFEPTPIESKVFREEYVGEMLGGESFESGQLITAFRTRMNEGEEPKFECRYTTLVGKNKYVAIELESDYEVDQDVDISLAYKYFALVQLRLNKENPRILCESGIIDNALIDYEVDKPEMCLVSFDEVKGEEEA